jgi:hypothetical protein
MLLGRGRLCLGRGRLCLGRGRLCLGRGRLCLGRSSLSLAAIIVATIVLAGCYSSATASYHPGDASQLVQQVTRRGAVIVATVSGDTGCSDASLTDNALRLTITVADDATPRPVYIFTFRSTKWDGSQAPVDACQAAFAEANPGTHITRLDIAPYRAFGGDWSPSLSATITAALTDASNLGE